MKKQKICIWAVKDNERILIEEINEKYDTYLSRIELPRISKFIPLHKDTWIEIDFREPEEVETKEVE